MSHRFRTLAVLLPAALALSACAQTPPAPPAPDAKEVRLQTSSGFDAGLRVARDVGATDLGLPLYPGAVLQRDGKENKNDKDDPNAVRLSLWGGSIGVNLAAASYRSEDDVDRIGRFYREALSRQGPLLDCGAADAPRGESREPGPLTCGKDKPEAGNRLYKIGTPKHVRVISIKRLADGASEIGLVRVDLR